MDRPSASRVNKGKRKATTQESPSSDNAEAQQRHHQHNEATRSSARPNRGLNSAPKRGDYIFNYHKGKDRRDPMGPGQGSAVKTRPSASRVRTKEAL